MSIEVDCPAAGVQRIRINRPDARNAINAAVRGELLAALKGAVIDKDVRSVVIGGTNGMFSAGGDLPSLAGLDEASAYARLRDGNQIVTLLWEFPKPVVAAVERFAVGAGASLALLADEIIMGESAVMAFPFARLGLLPDWGLSGVLPRRVGPAASLRLIAHAASLNGSEAVAVGLADEMIDDSRVMGVAIARATSLAALPGNVFAAAKCRQRGDAETVLQLDREAREQAACIASRDFEEGYAAFREKRAPRFFIQQ